MLRSVAKGVHNDAPEVCIMANACLANVRWDLGDRDGAMRSFTKALRICETLTESDYARTQFVGPIGPLAGGRDTVRSIVDDIKKMAEGSIATLEGKERPVSPEGPEPGILGGGSFQAWLATLPRSERAAQIAEFLAGNPLTEADRERNRTRYKYKAPSAETAAFLERATAVRGQQCDQCHKPRSASVSLSMCSRCKKRWFCGPECQRMAWKLHKKVCRKSGQFKHGDRVLIRNVPPQWDIVDGMMAIVVDTQTAEEKGDDRTWLVKVPSPEGVPSLPPMPIPAESLEYVFEDGL